MSLKSLFNADTIKKLIPHLPNDEKQTLQDLFVYHNLLRLRVIAKYLLAFMILLIVIQLVFMSKVTNPGIIDIAPTITVLRVIYITITSLFLILAKAPPTPKEIKPSHNIYVSVYLVYSLIYFAALTSIIQSVVYGIAVSYIMAVIVTAAFIYLSFPERITIFGLTWLAMSALTWYFQRDWIVAFSVFLDCTIINILGIVISSVIYTNKVKDYLNQQALKYQSNHDELTGLYNRQYFKEVLENRINKLKSIGIIVCDVNGLKFVNDTLGHQAGDRLLLTAAKILNDSIRSFGIAARIGGDEFLIILPDIKEHEVQNIVNNIKINLGQYNKINSEFPLSISCGYSFSNNNIDVPKLFTEADDNMYKEKLYQSQSNRSNTVKILMKALEARDHITEGHADRLQNLVLLIAKDLNMPEDRLLDLRLFAQFHDIGKVGIPDSILFKPGPLTAREMSEMQRHCDIGHRIALSSTELSPIADYILKHHEWWNGKGYPLGLEGNQIPLACRILAIVDAFDAMTSDRPYRKAMPEVKALNELEKFAGIQFDPTLVAKFVKLVKKQNFYVIS